MPSQLYIFSKSFLNPPDNWKPEPGPEHDTVPEKKGNICPEENEKEKPVELRKSQLIVKNI